MSVTISGTWPGNGGGALASWSFPVTRFSGVCVDIAMVTCTPGQIRLPLFLGGQVTANIFNRGSAAVNYWSQRFYLSPCTSASVGSPRCLYADNLRIEQDDTGVPAAGGAFQLRVCITASDRSPNSCICSGTCDPQYSYVDLTSYYAGP